MGKPRLLAAYPSILDLPLVSQFPYVFGLEDAFGAKQIQTPVWERACLETLFSYRVGFAPCEGKNKDGGLKTTARAYQARFLLNNHGIGKNQRQK